MLHLPQGGMLLIQTQGIPWEKRKRETPTSWRKTTETTREVKADLQVTDFMKQHNISAKHAIKLMGNYYSHDNAAITWEKTV